MKNSFVMIPVLLLVGCISVPVDREFPKAPDALQVAPPKLKEIPADAPADQVFGTVIDNYGAYHDVAGKLRGWQQWYIEQQKVFNSIK